MLGDEVVTVYETSKWPRLAANMMLLISCCTLFLVRDKLYCKFLEMKLPKLRHSSLSAEAAAGADDVSIVNAFSRISSHSSLLFIFFHVFGGTDVGGESTVYFFF